MADAFLIVLVVFTSLGALVLGGVALRLPLRSLVRSLHSVAEWAGLAVVFFAANLVVGAGIILALRALGGRFVSLYIVADPTLLVLSAVQAAAFQRWRDSGAARPLGGA